MVDRLGCKHVVSLYHTGKDCYRTATKQTGSGDTRKASASGACHACFLRNK